MKQNFKIHGDNVVECERISSILFSEINPHKFEKFLISPSTITIECSFTYYNQNFDWHIELLPGFNKAGRARWNGDIFKPLRENGGFLDETPDAIITEVVGDNEKILCAIEFCSALQAGNQAWQRSGRAFSIGLTGCPYLYIVDFGKYELEPSTRKEKNLRFPNAAVPYSFINFSRVSNNFVAQVYIKSESFDRQDPLLRDFNENNFVGAELRRYLVKKMAHMETHAEENMILRKNFEVVCFLANKTNPNKNLSVNEWKEIFTDKDDVVDYCVKHQRFNFHKTITQKGMHGHLPQILSIIDSYSVGLASKDLPMGIIPSNKRENFGTALYEIYPNFNQRIINEISYGDTNLIICLFKGFKPGGDDNRPDRGVLPLATMLSDKYNEVMAILYGPILFRNYQLLMNDAKILARHNGLWKSILSMSDYVLVDAPILENSKVTNAEELLFTKGLKQQYATGIKKNTSLIQGTVFRSIPKEYHEDDVDTGIHYLFTEVLKDVCFEGMCNPPGGDWSGFSVLYGDSEKRWLSLPRVSDEIGGKRPDHIIEIFGLLEQPILLLIESKEKSADLEPNVGQRLVQYVEYLMKYVPNVERNILSYADWYRGQEMVNVKNFTMISAAAYLKDKAQSDSDVYKNSNCDMLFVMKPLQAGWKIEIICFTLIADRLKQYLKGLVDSSPNNSIEIY